MGAIKKLPFKKIKADIVREYNFVKNIFSISHIPLKGEDDESVILSAKKSSAQEGPSTVRARTIADLEEKLQKIKSEKTFSLKNKYIKKSLASKLNKKIKKKQRLVKKEKPVKNETTAANTKNNNEQSVNVAKPIFNNDGKLVFSKFDFANLGHKEKSRKSEKDPKKLLEQLKKQEEKVKQLELSEGSDKVNEVKDKLAWKNILKKAEGEKVKDDPALLKKSIKKIDQLKKQSKKKWDTRVANVEQKRQERQQKRKDNISKKKKEKKAKKVKASVKRGRIVI